MPATFSQHTVIHIVVYQYYPLFRAPHQIRNKRPRIPYAICAKYLFWQEFRRNIVHLCNKKIYLLIRFLLMLLQMKHAFEQNSIGFHYLLTGSKCTHDSNIHGNSRI